MDNSSYIWFIDSHPESNCCDHNSQLSSHKSILNRSPSGSGQSSMISFSIPIDSFPFFTRITNFFLFIVLQTGSNISRYSLTFISSRTIYNKRLQTCKSKYWINIVCYIRLQNWNITGLSRSCNVWRKINWIWIFVEAAATNRFCLYWWGSLC